MTLFFALRNKRIENSNERIKKRLKKEEIQKKRKSG
jgi:hypothetical protein